MRATQMRLQSAMRLRRQPAGAASLLDVVMPEYDALRRRGLIVRAPADAVYAALTTLPLEPPRAVRLAFGVAARGARFLHRAAPRAPQPAHGLIDRATARGFVRLTERRQQEILLGVAGRAWRVAAHRAHLRDAGEWCAYEAPGAARAALALRVEPIDYQTARLLTETRVHTRGLGARLIFGAYWAVGGRLNGLLGMGALRQVKAAAERDAGLFRLSA
jgi:hypothetical protein